jgi:hypothetical protein
MALPRDLIPSTLQNSNVLLLLYVMATQFQDAEDELYRVRDDRNIAQARGDTLEANWGTLVGVGFDASFSVDKYKEILLGVIKAKTLAPTKAALRQAVMSFAPSATVEIYDYWKDPSQFVAPDPNTFFTLNGTQPGNTWNSLSAVWAPGQLLRNLGVNIWGTQVQVTNLAEPADITYLHFVPEVLVSLKPAHTFVALVYDQEVVLDL